MPVTAQAGKMSWALMRHPKGLDCDLFISHAWQEGVFEFLSKVLHSWPAGARHVWCCMLANPQHLDISSSLDSTNPKGFIVLTLQSVITTIKRVYGTYTFIGIIVVEGTCPPPPPPPILGVRLVPKACCNLPAARRLRWHFRLRRASLWCPTATVVSTPGWQAPKP